MAERGDRNSCYYYLESPEWREPELCLIPVDRVGTYSPSNTQYVRDKAKGPASAASLITSSKISSHTSLCNIHVHQHPHVRNASCISVHSRPSRRFHLLSSFNGICVAMWRTSQLMTASWSGFRGSVHRGVASCSAPLRHSSYIHQASP